MDYIKYNANPKGKITGDCVIRAICTAVYEPWENVYSSLCELGKKKGKMPNDPAVYSQYLRNKGFEQMKTLTHPSGRKLTLRELADETRDYIVLAHCRSHLTCIIYGVIIDTWNCGYKTSGKYWRLHMSDLDKIGTCDDEVFMHLNILEELAEEQKQECLSKKRRVRL